MIDTRQTLATAVSREVAAGWRVESQTDVQAVMVKGKQINHLLHLILTLFTFGFWVFVWVPVWAFNRRRAEILTVDEYGNVLKQDAR